MKKGLEFLSNRIVVSVILIIIQIIAILIFVYTLFIDFIILKIMFMILSILVVLYIINKDDDPSYKNYLANSNFIFSGFWGDFVSCFWE